MTEKNEARARARAPMGTHWSKTLLSLLMAVVMLVGLLPVQAIAEEGEECLGSCNHVHWGSAICDGCHLCSADCPKGGDCWYESHCKNCGGCYMSADNWCDECGWCQDCMEDEAHCRDCGRCFVGESKDELCGDCQRCSDCIDVCLECNKCIDCFDEYEHCQFCPTHLEDAPCGYCDECAEAEGLHCEECEACFEGGAERCPVHDTHCAECALFVCAECDRCEYEDEIEKCPDCELCTECSEEKSKEENCSTGEVCVESIEWETHFCRECDECFCDKDKCSKCDLCEECCKNKGGCAGCDCAETTGEHRHRFDADKWVIDPTNHWNECRVCHEKVNTAAHNDADGDGYCDACGFDQAHPLYISKQPKDLVKKVSNKGLKPSDPDHPNKNRAQFSVEANDWTNRTLTYQWYWVRTNRETGVKEAPSKLIEEANYAKGVTTDTLDIGVPSDGCQYSYEFFCEITATAADGSTTTITSRYARLRTVHNYGFLEATDLSTKTEVTVVLDSNGAEVTSYQGSEYHNATCIGDNCGRAKLPATTKHNYKYKEDLGAGHIFGHQDVTKYFYLMECPDCGQNDLRSSDTPDDAPHSIALNAPEGAYAYDLSAEKKVTSAIKDTEIELFAPTLNGEGHVFTGWKVIEGDVTLIKNHNPGIYTFYMPADNVELEAQYDASRYAVESIKINTIKVNGNEVPLVNNTITVKVGDVIEATAALNPDEDIMDERVRWAVIDFGGGMEPRLSIIGADEPTASPVQLKALKTTSSKLYLRATAYASELGTDLKAVSDIIYVNIVADSEHTCEYKVTTVHPTTCTLMGYTLYECKGCGKSHKAQFTKPYDDHSDTDNDKLCDNIINEETGETCGFNLKAGGSDDFVGREKITAAQLTVTAPVTGQKPADALKTTKEYTVARTRWMTVDGTELDANGTFAPGMVYTVMVTLEANDGYAFQPKDSSFTKSLKPTAVVKATKFTINSNPATLGKGSSKDSVELIYKFTPTEGEHSHSFVAWKFDDTNHWEGCACGERKNVEPHTESARITDIEAGIGTEGAWHTECEVCHKTMSSGTIAALEKIDKAEVTVTAPARGGKPKTATVKDTEARYYVADTDWEPVVKNRFASGTKYTVKVTLAANDGYAFDLTGGLLGAGKTSFTINGNKATVVSGNAQQVIITYEFPATGSGHYNGGNGGSGSSGGSSGTGSGGTTNKPVKSPSTGDPGVMLYAAMGLLSLSGGAWIVGRKRKDK